MSSFAWRKPGHTAPARKPSPCRPRLEALEDRRLLSAGALDPSFGSGGTLTTALGSLARAYAVATYPAEGTANDGKVVAVGFAYPSTGNTSTADMAVVRYNTNGTLDTTFGGTGEVMNVPGLAFAVAVQPDGKVVVAGDEGGKFEVVRYNADGTPDTSFGSKGVASTAITANGNAELESLVLQPDGKIVVAGVNNPKGTSSEDLALVRFNANGSLDTTFGTGGKVTTRFAAPLTASSNPAAWTWPSTRTPAPWTPTAASSWPWPRRRPGPSRSCATIPTAPWTRASAATRPAT